MEAFEHVVKVYLEQRGYVVSTNVKFPVRRQTSKKTREIQTHGYEVDVVAARHGSLLLGSVKSFLDSIGVAREGFLGLAKNPQKKFLSRYTLFNSSDVRKGVIAGASKRFGYRPSQIELALFVGKFKPKDELAIREFLSRKKVQVFGLEEILSEVIRASASKTYANDPVVMTVKCLQRQGLLLKDLESPLQSPVLRSTDFRGLVIIKPDGTKLRVASDNKSVENVSHILDKDLFGIKGIDK